MRSKIGISIVITCAKVFPSCLIYISDIRINKMQSDKNNNPFLTPKCDTKNLLECLSQKTNPFTMHDNGEFSCCGGKQFNQQFAKFIQWSNRNEDKLKLPKNTDSEWNNYTITGFSVFTKGAIDHFHLRYDDKLGFYINKIRINLKVKLFRKVDLQEIYDRKVSEGGMTFEVYKIKINEPNSFKKETFKISDDISYDNELGISMDYDKIVRDHFLNSINAWFGKEMIMQVLEFSVDENGKHEFEITETVDFDQFCLDTLEERSQVFTEINNNNLKISNSENQVNTVSEGENKEEMEVDIEITEMSEKGIQTEKEQISYDFNKSATVNFPFTNVNSRLDEIKQFINNQKSQNPDVENVNNNDFRSVKTRISRAIVELPSWRDRTEINLGIFKEGHVMNNFINQYSWNWRNTSDNDGYWMGIHNPEVSKFRRMAKDAVQQLKYATFREKHYMELLLLVSGIGAHSLDHLTKMMDVILKNNLGISRKEKFHFVVSKVYRDLKQEFPNVRSKDLFDFKELTEDELD
jgi:hypothetical protein